jgi:glycerol-3-phosphate dehydrogenase
MPITETLHQVLNRHADLDSAIARLLARLARARTLSLDADQN